MSGSSRNDGRADGSGDGASLKVKALEEMVKKLQEEKEQGQRKMKQQEAEVRDR
jgi:hypothetical protein